MLEYDNPDLPAFATDKAGEAQIWGVVIFANRFLRPLPRGQGRKAEARSVPRILAPETEAAIVAALREQDPTRRAHLREAELVEACVDRIEVRAGLLAIVLPAGSHAPTISAPWQPDRSRTDIGNNT